MGAPQSVPPAGPAAQIGVTDVRRLWPQVLDAVKAQNRRAHALLESAAVTVVRVEGGVLLLSTQFPALARMVSEARNSDLVQAALRDILGVEWRIRCVEAGAEGPSAGEPGAGPSRGAAAPAPGARGASDPVNTPPGRSAPAAAGSSSGGSARSGASRDHHAGGDQPPDEEPDRGAPPEPDDPYDADYDPYSEIDPDADPAGSPSYEVHDPSKIAIDLITAKLGARPIDDDTNR